MHYTLAAKELSMRRVIVVLVVALWAFALAIVVIPASPTVKAQGLMPPTLTTGARSLTATDAGTCIANNTGCAVLTVSGLSYVWVQIDGTFVGTLTFETTVNGSTWTTYPMLPTTSASTVTTATAAGIWTGKAAVSFRVRMTAYTSGTASVTVTAKAN